MYRNIPQSLLLLSRAFKITTAAAKKPAKARDANEQTLEGLRNTFNMLPDETIADVEMERFKSTTSLEKRLEYLQRVEQDIQDENATEADLATAREELEVRRAAALLSDCAWRGAGGGAEVLHPGWFARSLLPAYADSTEHHRGCTSKASQDLSVTGSLKAQQPNR